MAIVSREKLKKAFAKGAVPSEQDFQDLLDSMRHQEEDGLSSQEESLKLSPKGSHKRLIAFLNSISDLEPTWGLEQHPKGTPEFGLNLVDRNGKSRLYVSPQGRVGVGTLRPSATLEVAGPIVSTGRRGSYACGEVPGDAQWHSITPPLNFCHAFEVMAKIGKPGKGLYAMLHATALSTFGQSSSSIRKTQAHYGSFRNKLELRWAGTTFNYGLQIRTRRDYGSGHAIKYYITNLWWEE